MAFASVLGHDQNITLKNAPKGLEGNLYGGVKDIELKYIVLDSKSIKVRSVMTALDSIEQPPLAFTIFAS